MNVIIPHPAPAAATLGSICQRKGSSQASPMSQQVSIRNCSSLGRPALHPAKHPGAPGRRAAACEHALDHEEEGRPGSARSLRSTRSMPRGVRSMRLCLRSTVKWP